MQIFYLSFNQKTIKTDVLSKSGCLLAFMHSGEKRNGLIWLVVIQLEKQLWSVFAPNQLLSGNEVDVINSAKVIKDINHSYFKEMSYF